MAQTWGLVYTKSEYAYHNITGATEQKFKDVKSFIYIGALFANFGGRNKDIKRRLSLTRITNNNISHD